MFQARKVAVLSAAAGSALIYRRKKEQVDAKSAWPLSEFELLSPTAGISKFPTSSWSNFITYKDKNGESKSLIWPHAIAKNYSEIAISNLFRYALKLDPNILKSPAWRGKGFFMRYQELEFFENFHEILSCPRTFSDVNVPQVTLNVHTSLVQVGKSSALAEQKLVVNGEIIGRNAQQVTCIERGKPGAAPLPNEFLELEYIKPLRKAPRPNFQRTFLSDISLEQAGKVEFGVFQSDTDENRHMNESVYLRMAMDAILQVKGLHKHQLVVKKIQALYHKEILAGKQVQVTVFDGGEGVYVTMFVVDNVFSFECRIESRTD